MTTQTDHWNTIFETTADNELGWYERNASRTLELLELISQNEPATIFLPGAGTSILVDELLKKGHELILNDISDKALNNLRGRIGNNDSVIWLHQDISKTLPDDIPQVDIWIDRAVLHFLLEEADIQRYFTNLHSTLRPGGYTLLAEFSTTGAPMCAGLKLHRYSIEELVERIGNDFDLVKCEHHTYKNPSGGLRPYIYALFRKQIG